jgi:hypothetical protein
MSRLAPEKRLRTSAERSASVMESAAAACRRREDLHRNFIAKLEAELGASQSVLRLALIESAASAYLEVVELSSRFRRCRSSQAEQDRLSTARSQLNRTLRLLGVAAKPSDAPAAASEASLADWTARQLADDAEDGE